MGIKLSRGVPGSARFLVASARCGGFCYNPRGLGPPEPPHIPPLFFPIWPLNWEVLNGLLWDARTSEQEGIGGSLCPDPSRGWARHCQPSTLLSLPCRLGSGPPLGLHAPRPGLFSVPRSLGDVCPTLFQPLNFFRRNFPSPSSALLREWVGARPMSRLLESGLGWAEGGWELRRDRGQDPLTVARAPCSQRDSVL